MRCDVASDTPCWCQHLPPIVRSLDALDATRDCVCAACLQAQCDAGVVLYGIPNCDTVKKARLFLEAHGIAYTFWNYKQHGVPAALLSRCLNQHGWQTVCNTRGPTWRKLPDDLKSSVVDAASALPVLMANASAIKRPIVAWGQQYQQAITVGFDVTAWQVLLGVQA
jgi:Spx/MgsR family transcriptional regulator